MSVLDSIIDLKTHDLTVIRYAEGSFNTDGLWVKGSSTTFVVEACVQPATGMQRVVGGRDMRSDEQGQKTDDVRVVYTPTELKTRDVGFEPDQIVNLEGGTWTVTRVEPYQAIEFFDDPTDIYYRVLITKETHGAA